MMKDVWIVDDDRSIRWVMQRALQKQQMACRTFEKADDLLDVLKTEQPSVIVSDIHMPGKSGLELLTEVKTLYPKIPVIIMTAFSDLDSAVASFQKGAFEYLPKPFDINKAIELIQRLRDETEEKESEPISVQLSEIIGKSAAMQEVFRAIGRLAHVRMTVLITGESGAGKEVVARALHKHSMMANSEFVALNMAAIPRDLMESELFGHERGAFTGANSIRYGRFEQAAGGTLFLDEIGDMPAELQTRLLRVLSDGYFYRVGGHQPIKSNVRVIAATHQDLEQMVRDGLFREDLYHRLNVIRLRLPPLRKRSEDIPLLVNHFLQSTAKNVGVEPKKLTDDCMNFLKGFPFPGNVRQLENLCNWLTVMAPSQLIRISDLPEEIRNYSLLNNHSGDGKVEQVPSTDWVDILEQEISSSLARGEVDVMKKFSDAFEKTVINAALKFTHGKRVEASNKLGIGRNTITRKIVELGLDNK